MRLNGKFKKLKYQQFFFLIASFLTTYRYEDIKNFVIGQLIFTSQQLVFRFLTFHYPMLIYNLILFLCKVYKKYFHILLNFHGKIRKAIGLDKELTLEYCKSDDDAFEFIDEIGKGAYGVVHSAIDRKGELVAVKSISLTERTQEYDNVIEEARLLAQFSKKE